MFIPPRAMVLRCSHCGWCRLLPASWQRGSPPASLSGDRAIHFLMLTHSGAQLFDLCPECGQPEVARTSAPVGLPLPDNWLGRMLEHLPGQLPKTVTLADFDHFLARKEAFK